MKFLAIAFLIISVLASNVAAAQTSDGSQSSPHSSSQEKGSVPLTADPYKNVSILTNGNERTSSFNNDFAKHNIGGLISTCSQLVKVSVGTTNGNESYGGICIWEEEGMPTNVMICNDKLAGYFKLQKIDPDKTTRKQLIDFVISNCYGG